MHESKANNKNANINVTKETKKYKADAIGGMRASQEEAIRQADRRRIHSKLADGRRVRHPVLLSDRI